VVTVDRARKWLIVGTIDGPYRFISEEPLRSGGKPYRHALPVSWMFAVARAKEGPHSFPETCQPGKSAFRLKDNTVAAIMKATRISLAAYPQTVRRTTANPVPRLMSEAPVDAGADALSQWLDKNERLAEALPSDELAARAAAANPQARKVEFGGTGFVRDSFVAALAKQLAGGRCDLCAKAAPFRSTDGLPFLESHHVKWLSRNGRDAIDNVVALCPNCHRKMHVRDEKADRNLSIRVRHFIR